MKNNLLWGAVVVVAIILFAVLMSGGGNNTESENTKVSTTTEVSKTQATVKSTTKSTTVAPVPGMKTSLGGIFNEKGSYQCDYESASPSSRTSNVVYVSDGRMRGEFRTYDAGFSKVTIVVYDGSYLYVWTEGYPTGKVSQPKTLADLPGIIPEDVSSGKVLTSGSSSVSWSCHAWSRVPSLLQKPNYVTFN
jgi:hypothetical protein